MDDERTDKDADLRQLKTDFKTWWKKASKEKDPEDYTKQQLGNMYDRDIKFLNTIWVLILLAGMSATYSLSAAIHEKTCNEFLYDTFVEHGIIMNDSTPAMVWNVTSPSFPKESVIDTS